MDIKDLMKLIDAGFTKEDIMNMKLHIDNQYGASTDATEEIEQPSEDVQETKAEPDKKQETPAIDTRLDDVIKGLQKVTETMQKTALQNSRQPEPESVDDILANIINPTYKKG